MSDFTPLLPKEKLLEKINETRDKLGISGSEIGKFIYANQSTMSNLLNPSSKNPRNLSYEEAYDIVLYLTSKMSLIPRGLTVGDLMTGNGKLMWVTSDQTLGEISQLMYKMGFSQMPVKKGDATKGIVTDLSILRALMGGVFGSLDEAGKLSLEKANVVESVFECPSDTTLLEAANMLLGYPAVFVSHGANIVGVLTRADLLKLLFSKY